MEVHDKIYLQKVNCILFRVLGLSKETLLKFVLDGNNLKLDSWIKIKDLKEANASISQGKFKLDILCNSDTLKKKLYFGGEEADA